MIDMFDLPTDKELINSMNVQLESTKKQDVKPAKGLDVSSIFPGWTPINDNTYTTYTDYATDKRKLDNYIVSNNTGVVKMPKFDKDIEKNPDIMDMWDNFIEKSSKQKLKDNTGIVKCTENPNKKEPVINDTTTKPTIISNARDGKDKPTTPVKTTIKQITNNVDAFGSVTVDSFANTEKIIDKKLKPKALLKTNTTNMEGNSKKIITELGTNEVITKTYANKPKETDLVGIVKSSSLFTTNIHSNNNGIISNTTDLKVSKETKSSKEGIPYTNDNSNKTVIVKDFAKKLSIDDVNSKLEIKSNAQTPNKNNLIGIVKVPKNA